MRQCMMDHIGHGRNQRKWHENGEVADPCPLCGDTNDDMQHVAVECTNPAMQVRRDKCWDDCYRLLEQPRTQGVIGQYLGAMISTMKEGRTRDTHAIMLGRPLDHHVRSWDLCYGPQVASTGNTFRKYVSKLLAVTMMAVIGLWMCRGTERQRMQHSDISIQQILFPDMEGECESSSPNEDYNSQARVRAGRAMRDRPVADGGWGAAISHSAVGIEWAPDPPQMEMTGLEPVSLNY